MITRISMGLCLSAIGLLATSEAYAQLNNRPYSFGSVTGGPSGGAGMSLAGRQAILAEKMFGARPHFFVVGPSGDLLSVRKGPGSVPIVQDAAGNFIPQPRGSALGGGSLRAAGFGFTAVTTRASISAWAAMVDGWRRPMTSGPTTSMVIDEWTNSVAAE